MAGQPKARSEPQATCTPKAWSRLMGLHDAFEATKSREKNLVTTRKSLDAELDELGAGDSSAHLRKSRDLVVTQRAIKAERAKTKELADKISMTILAAKQGKLEFGEEEPEDYRPPAEAELFAPKKMADDDDDDDDDEEEGDDPADHRPVGVITPGVPAKPQAPADRPYFRTSIADLDGVADRAVSVLKRNGVTTVWDVLHPPTNDGVLADIKTVKGITPGDVADIEKAISLLEQAWAGGPKGDGVRPGEQVDGDGVITKAGGRKGKK